MLLKILEVILAKLTEILFDLIIKKLKRVNFTWPKRFKNPNEALKSTFLNVLLFVFVLIFCDQVGVGTYRVYFSFDIFLI